MVDCVKRCTSHCGCDNVCALHQLSLGSWNGISKPVIISILSFLSLRLCLSFGLSNFPGFSIILAIKLAYGRRKQMKSSNISSSFTYLSPTVLTNRKPSIFLCSTLNKYEIVSLSLEWLNKYLISAYMSCCLVFWRHTVVYSYVNRELCAV